MAGDKQISADAYWLALRRVRGLGPRIAHLLLESFGSAPAIFAAEESALVAAGIYRTTARNIVQFSDFEPLERELCELERIGGHLVRWSDDGYPYNLRHIPDPPPYLFVRGQLREQEREAVAIVGARTASDAGRHMARRLGLELAAKGIAVVSGLARGIDSEAHAGALEAGGHTLAVLGCGVDIIYPGEHRRLAQDIIASGGALLSELALGVPPQPENFPVRNRIIAGLSLGVVVVEAAEKSGSLITARLALEQDRQVFAVPGSPLGGKARGSNRLLKDGARLVECVEDVIEELAPQLATLKVGAVATAPKPSGPGQLPTLAGIDSDKVKSVIEGLADYGRVHIDSIVEKSGLSPQSVLGILLELELMGMVTQYPGKLFSLARI